MDGGDAAAGTDSIKVFCRVRGGATVPGGRKAVVAVEDAERVVVGGKHTFSFSWAGGPDASQEEVFSAVAAPLTQSFLAGFNCCVFTYGQLYCADCEPYKLLAHP